MNLPGSLRNDDLRASFTCLAGSEVLTGCWSGERAPLSMFPSNAELVMNWPYGAEFDSDWLLEVKLYDKCDVFKLCVD